MIHIHVHIMDILIKETQKSFIIVKTAQDNHIKKYILNAKILKNTFVHQLRQKVKVTLNSYIKKILNLLFSIKATYMTCCRW